MIVDFPPPTITIGHGDLWQAVEDYLVKTGRLHNGGTLADLRLGNMIKTDLLSCNALGSPRGWLAGTVTFELLKD